MFGRRPGMLEDIGFLSCSSAIRVQPNKLPRTKIRTKVFEICYKKSLLFCVDASVGIWQKCIRCKGVAAEKIKLNCLAIELFIPRVKKMSFGFTAWLRCLGNFRVILSYISFLFQCPIRLKSLAFYCLFHIRDIYEQFRC